MTRTALAVSPHLDDAVFSCGAMLAMLAASGWRVTVATVFTASVEDPRGFALACQLDKGLDPDVDYMALRRAEDAEAMQALGVEAPVWLPFREAPHRGYQSAPDLFTAPRQDDAIGGALGAALERLIEDRKPDLLLGPQAVGGHVDHVQVVRALIGAAGAAPVMWWSDFPYSVRSDTPKRPFANIMATLHETGFDLAAPSLERKRSACRAYATQIGYQFGGIEGLDRRLDASGGLEAFRSAAPPPRL